MQKKHLELLFLSQVRDDPRVPEPEREFQFYPGRRWRFDFAWPSKKIAVEIQGGIWGRRVWCHACGIQVLIPAGDKMVPALLGSGHNTGAGFIKTIEKLNHAAAAGWAVLQFDTDAVDDGSAAAWLGDVVFGNGVEPGMPAGYEFAVTDCPECGKSVKSNWIIRHLKSGCKKG